MEYSHLLKILLLTFFVSCAGTQQSESSAETKKNDAQKPSVGVEIKKSWPHDVWQEYAYKKVAILPRTSDEKEWCPQGLTQANWTHLMAAIAKNESNFNPRLEYGESFSTKGRQVISTGLFQVSTGSANPVYGFNFDQSDLYDPYNNIDVAVEIMRRWTLSDGVVAKGYNKSTAKGGARYWSVLRSGEKGKIDKVKAYLRKYCQ